MRPFKIQATYTPTGDQPQAIAQICQGLDANQKHQILKGVTGSGKTFTMANIIEQVQRPTLVLAHNKTLAAQLFSEFRELFPDNAVEYFVSYYDYYQPEAYIINTDTFIEKDSSINDDIDKMRHSATTSLLSRRDVIIVSSVSCIYGIGDPQTYKKMAITIEKGGELDRDAFLRSLVDIQYERNDIDFHRGTFRVRGDIIDILPADKRKEAIRIEFFGDTVEEIAIIDPITGEVLEQPKQCLIFPGSHYVTDQPSVSGIINQIQIELQDRLQFYKKENKLVEYQRLESRTMHDIEMIQEIGYCSGIENYSRFLTGRKPGEAPPTLLDYFPKDFLLFIDESHVSVPQIGGMFKGDRSRKETLVEFGFRLPAALDNRPLTFSEFENIVGQTIYVSATPAKYELGKTGDKHIDQIIRPTGLVDPQIIVKPTKDQVNELYSEINEVIKRGERILITTLTKRFAEELTQYYSKLEIKCEYLHSEIDSIERVEIIRRLRSGEIDVLIGVNLLREGLDLPEVSLVAVLDADKQGFLRSASSLIQTTGRAARNVNGKVLFFGDTVTDAMRTCIDETVRRRQIQTEYNRQHNITPKSIQKNISKPLKEIYNLESDERDILDKQQKSYSSLSELKKDMKQLRAEMKEAAKELNFEKAATLRDRLFALQKLELSFL